jgi:hypothetical protein
MGLKLRYAKKYEVKWSGMGHFNYLQEDLNRFLYDLSGGFDDYLGEHLDFTEQFEINKDTLREIIEKLNDYNDNELPSRFRERGYSCKSIRDFLAEALENSDPKNDYVVFAWF